MQNVCIWLHESSIACMFNEHKYNVTSQHTGCARALLQSRVPLWRSLLHYLLTEPVWCYVFLSAVRVGPLIFRWGSACSLKSK